MIFLQLGDAIVVAPLWEFYTEHAGRFGFRNGVSSERMNVQIYTRFTMVALSGLEEEEERKGE